MMKKFYHWLLLAALVCGLGFTVTSCKDDDDEPQPVHKVEKGAPFEVMVAFAPGQLGDRGYADDVLEGVNSLARFANVIIDSVGDYLDVRFFSPYHLEELQENIEMWAGNAVNPFVDDSYQRRLLVLTEPYMIHFLDSVKTVLRPSDEVLVMKVNEDDIRQAAEKFGLDGRLHGLNISAAYSIRRFCQMMKYDVVNAAKHDKIINYNTLPIYRLYDEKTMIYHDSIPETLAEELGSETTFYTFTLSSEEGNGVFSADGASTVYELAYLWAETWQSVYANTRSAYTIIDIGSGNAGWDYWLMGRNDGKDTFQTLVIDGNAAPLANRYYVTRNFSYALINWVSSWMNQPVASMPAVKYYANGKKDDLQYCTDNIPDYKVME